MPQHTFVPALGHPRVDAAAADAERRVLAHDGDRVVGVGTFDPCGGDAEALISLAPDASGGLVPYLFDELTVRAARLGVRSLRFEFPVDEQHGVAERLAAGRSGCAVRRHHLEVRTVARSAGSAQFRHAA